MQTINDEAFGFLKGVTSSGSGSYNDLHAEYLRNLGYIGTLSDMIGKSGIGIALPNTLRAGGGAGTVKSRSSSAPLRSRVNQQILKTRAA